MFVEAGNMLRSAREAMGLSIEEVSSGLKIRPNIISEMEKGNFTFMPAVYLISFFKSYSQFLKLDADETESIINAIKKKSNIQNPAGYYAYDKMQAEKASKGKHSVPNFKQSAIINYLIYTALGLTAVALVYITFFYSSDNEKKNFTGDKNVSRLPDTAVIKGNNNELTDFYTRKDSIVLTAVGIDTAWLRLNIDGNTVDQILMTKGMEKSWFANEFIVLSLGNEGAVKFQRNGKDLPSFGTKGSIIRNVKIFSDRVEIASSPWATKDSTEKRRKKKEPKPNPQPIKQIEPSTLDKNYNPLKK